MSPYGYIFSRKIKKSPTPKRDETLVTRVTTLINMRALKKPSRKLEISLSGTFASLG
jgi:hypothetical protein